MTSKNMFLDTPLGLLYAKVAGPIIVVMMANGLYTLVDGWFVGRFVGPDALSAVTMVFPLFMMLVALSTLVSSGFSSVFARYLGAGKLKLARLSLGSAALLSLVICLVLMGGYWAFGYDLILKIANGSNHLAVMGDVYLSLSIQYSLLFFISGLLGDSLRCQGKMVVMAVLSLLGNILNIGFNYLMIVELDYGVAGSAYGTAMAQTVTVLIALYYIYGQGKALKFEFGGPRMLTVNWKKYLALGAPTSLSYVGVSVMTGSVIYQLQIWNSDSYEVSVASYGIITRLMTFGYMPLLGLTLAQQAIVGNNFGAGLEKRVLNSLRVAVIIAVIYCLLFQFIFMVFPTELAGLFVDSAAVKAEMARTLPIISLLYFLFGPLLMFSVFFQAIGDAKRAAILGLVKIYLISFPMIHLMPQFMGELGIWYASPITEILGLVLTFVIIRKLYRRQNSWRGLLAPSKAR
jgi:MATE family, multidrug efflux pump